MRLPEADMVKFLSFFLAISLATLIFSLCLFDAPEYVHCVDLGVCEFLELNGDLQSICQASLLEILPSHFIPEILSRSVRPYSRKNLFHSLPKNKLIAPINLENRNPSKQNQLPSQVLLIIAISIIIS